MRSLVFLFIYSQLFGITEAFAELRSNAVIFSGSNNAKVLVQKLELGSKAQVDASANSSERVYTAPDIGGTLALSTHTPSVQIVSVTTATYTLLTTEAILQVDTTSNAISVQLPNPNTYRKFYIKDVTGNLGTNQLTLVRNGSEKIENVAASKIFYSPFGAWLIYSDGTNWWII